MTDVLHMKTTHEIVLTLEHAHGGHPIHLTIIRGSNGFGAISARVVNERVMWEVSVTALREILKLYDGLPPVPAGTGTR